MSVEVEHEPASKPLAAKLGPAGQDLALLLHAVKSRVLGPASAEPVRLGRFELIRRLGAGAMGAVYLARDPELEREVAIKHILPSFTGGQSEEATRRMQREARAMARLQHPHVVTIYEVGSQDGELFLAMEYVEGTTLREWLGAGSHTRAEILALFLAASEGLAHAHQAGLVHRDFKPENVLIGSEGQVKVSDFGLANLSVSAQQLEHSEPDVAIETNPDSLGLTMTKTGAVLGTPAYMSPEQFSNGPIDARSDQFAFCVSLYEALFGERPYAGAITEDLRDNVLADRRRPQPRGREVPGWILAVVERGLSPDPSARWPSMTALAEALRDDPIARRRRRLGQLAALAVVVAGAGIYAGQRHERSQVATSCVELGDTRAASWASEAKQRLEGGLLSGAPQLVVTLAPRVSAALDDYSVQWALARTTACTRHRVEHSWSEQLEHKAELCLESGLLNADALLAEFEHADIPTSWDLGLALMTLPTPDTCVARARLEQLPALPSLDPQQVQVLRGQLARARALRLAGKAEPALASAEAAVHTALSLAWPPLSAEAGLERGLALVDAERYDDASEALTQAYFLAVDHSAGEIAVRSANKLAIVTGDYQKQPAQGELWLRHARAAAQGAELGAHILDDLDRTQALLLAIAGEHEQAIAIHEGQLERDRARYPASYVGLPVSLAYLGAALLRAERLDEALAAYTEALELHASNFGLDHPWRGSMLKRVADIHADKGELDVAERNFEAALEIAERQRGPDSLGAARVLYALAYLKSADMKDHAAAIPLFERALAIREQRLGTSSKEVSDTLDALAGAHYRLGDIDEALVSMTRAMQIRERVFGPDHRHVALSLNNLAVVHKQRGDTQRARTYLERAHEIQVRTLDPEDWRLAALRRNIGQLLADQGEHAQARQWYERGLTGMAEHSEVERAQRLREQLIELLAAPLD